MTIKMPSEVASASAADTVVELVAPDMARRAWVSCDRDFYLMWAASAPADASEGILFPDSHGCFVEIPPGMGLYATRVDGNQTTNVRAGLYGVSAVPLAALVTLGAVTHNSVEVSWAEDKPAGQATWRPPPTSWRSRIRTAPADGNPGNWESAQSNTDDDRTFSGLQASTRVEIGITPTNARGAGPETIIAATTGAAP
ncbi:hypothetical protein F4Y93_12735 [Candidatus Poribacteria bacterium]|nr:hypothetical protein [Candidatus Poribacteria bacterium]